MLFRSSLPSRLLSMARPPRSCGRTAVEGVAEVANLSRSLSPSQEVRLLLHSFLKEHDLLQVAGSLAKGLLVASAVLGKAGSALQWIVSAAPEVSSR